MTYQLERFEGAALSPELRQDDREGGLGHWLHRARGALRRLLGRRPYDGVDELPPHLLRDIGLPADFRPRDGLAQPLPPV